MIVIPGKIRAVITAAILCAAGTAQADVFREFQVLNPQGKPVKATLCVGDKGDPVRFGGIVTDDLGKASILVPQTDAKGNPLPDVVLTAASSSSSLRQTLPMQEKNGAVGVTRLTLKEGAKANCGSAAPILVKDIPGFKTGGKIEVLAASEPRLPPSAVNKTLKLKGIDSLQNILNRIRETPSENTSPPPASSPGNSAGARREIAETCFGAAGMACGALAAEWGISTCVGIPGVSSWLYCTVNEGSWTHDQCCVRNPDGFLCGGASAGPGSVCSSEFGYAFATALTPYSWGRMVNSSVVNRTGVVTHDLYCAQSGTPVWMADRHRCCDGSREFSWTDAAAFTARNGAWVTTIPDARVCR